MTAQALGVISIEVNQLVSNAPPLAASQNSAEDTVQHSVETLTTMFPKLFSGELGCLKDVQVKLDIDPSVRPVIQPQRPVAFHLRDAVEKELLKQVEQGILERVFEKSGPTPWVANLVIVPKDR